MLFPHTNQHALIGLLVALALVVELVESFQYDPLRLCFASKRIKYSACIHDKSTRPNEWQDSNHSIIQRAKFRSALSAKSQRTGCTSKFRSGNVKAPRRIGEDEGRSPVSNLTPEKTSPYWLPQRRSSVDVHNFQDFLVDEEIETLQHLGIEYLSRLILIALRDSKKKPEDENDSSQNFRVSTSDKTCGSKLQVAFKNVLHGQFVDMTYSQKDGERRIEALFEVARPIDLVNATSTRYFNEILVLKSAIIALQSLLILGMQMAAKSSPRGSDVCVSRLELPTGEDAYRFDCSRDILQSFWEENETSHVAENILDFGQRVAIQKLKQKRDIRAGIDVLARLERKRSPKGAFDLLSALNIWTIHEDLSLLRSGVLTRFTPAEEKCALEAAKIYDNINSDVDSKLGLRRDLRHLKVYTIDAESTTEIDDGISVEKILEIDSSTAGKTERKRYWVHIADADHWAPRDSDVIKIAQIRSTSIYLPTGSISMFPEILSADCMALKARCDRYALSLGAEIMENGSIDVGSIIVTPSIVNVEYRLSYREVDEMLEEGVAFREEWELGDMLDLARRRRAYRISNGSMEGMVVQMPTNVLKVHPDPDAEDGTAIELEIESQFNSGGNVTAGAVNIQKDTSAYVPNVSPSNLLVTEMMIMAGEAMGKFGQLCIEERGNSLIGQLELPYRSQAAPDFRTRPDELRVLNELSSKRIGGGYCASWYIRRFMRPVSVSKEPLPHKAMGIDCYVQWSSPIRRYGDLQVHAIIKRLLRRKRIDQLLAQSKQFNTAPSPTADTLVMAASALVDINFRHGMAIVQATKSLVRTSREYWLLEYIRRLIDTGDDPIFECTVLGVTDPNRLQYSIFVQALALEHRYLSEKGELQCGETLWLEVSSVNPRRGLLTFQLSSNKLGLAQ